MRSKLIIFLSIYFLCGCNFNQKKFYFLEQIKECFPTEKDLKVKISENCVEKKFPVAKLTIFDEEDNSIICSASVLSSRRLLTAAHCFDGYVEKVSLEHHGNRYQVLDYKIHPNIKDEEEIVYRDVAIVYVDKDLEPPYVSIQNSSQLNEHQPIFFMGYGRLVLDNSQIGIFHAGQMKIDSFDTNFFKAKYNGKGHNTCEGDSGAPVFVEKNNSFKLIGITSTGKIRDCSQGDITVFINLGDNEVIEFIKKEVPEAFVS